MLTEAGSDLVIRELHLQIKLIELQGLLAQTQHEPRLKGPFPIVLYRSILTSLQTILDRLHSMRCVTTREEWFTVRVRIVLGRLMSDGDACWCGRLSGGTLFSP